MMNRLVAGSVSILLAAAEVGLLASPAGALAVCTGRSPHGPGGWIATKAYVSGITGVSALIEQYDPYYSGYADTGTNATIMMANQAITKWAQLGWFKSKLNGNIVHRESGLEFRSAYQNTFNWFGSEPLGAETWYEILKRPSIAIFDFYIDNVLVDTYSDPIGASNYQMFGETHDIVDQMPGSTSNHVVFKNGNYFTGYWTPHIMVSDPDPGTSDWAMTHPSSGRYEIWDKDC